MMNGLSLAMFAAVAVAASAPVAAQQVEIGYPPGSLGVRAIMSADFAEAERQLDDFRVHKHDPARLINLGYVLSKTGRAEAASRLFQQVLEEDSVDLILADGRTMSSHEIARAELRDLQAGR